MKRRDGVVFFCYSRNATPRGRISISGSYPRFPFLQNPAKFLFHLYLPLTPLFQSFFSIQSCRLGGQKPSCGRIFAGEFFCSRIFSFSLDIQTWISRASNIEIERFKNQNSSMRVGIQLSRRIKGKIKLFYRTESGCNLVDKKNGLLIWFKN